MPRAKRDSGRPDQLRNYIAGMFTDQDMTRIQRVINRYGYKKAAAVRHLTRLGLEVEEQRHPSTPKE